MVKNESGLVAWFLLATATWANGATRPTPAPAVLPTIPDIQRPEVRQVMEKPTLFAQGPAETFVCQPNQYFWFLDHPDQAVVVWRRLGAICVSIKARGDGFFSCTDDHGGEVVWETVHKSANQRIWFAQGKVRPSPILPLIPVRVVVVMNHNIGEEIDGGAKIQHQADVFLQMDSKTMATVTRMMGRSSQRLAQDGLNQLEFFFSGLCRYLHRHPEEARRWLALDK